MNATPLVQTTVELLLESPSGSRRSHRLTEGDRVLVGASDHCGLRIEDAAVSSYHCVISLEDGCVWVQEWSSAAETRVNGQPISGKTKLEGGDRLSVGQHQLVPQFTSETPGTVALEQPAAIDDEVHRAGSVDGRSPTDPPEFGAAGPGQDAPHEPLSDHADTTDAAWRDAGTSETAAAETQPESDAGPEPWFATAAATPGWASDLATPAGSFGDETGDAETVALLQAEIEDLRAALAQHDAAPDDFPTAEPEESPDVDAQAEEHERLAERLDQLLQEAESSDERIAALEEMLHTAEQANQAGQEERHQLQQWIGDIEHRIGQREAEWQAEIDAYQNQLAEAHRQRDAAQQQLRESAGQRGAASEAKYTEAIERLQQQNQQLQESLAEANKQRAALKQQLEQGDSRSDQELRAERAEIARERAEVSRMRHELSSKLAALEEMPEPKNQPDREYTGRLQALRDHLREIHVQEQQQRQQRDSTLTGRLSRLWNRLES